MLTDSIRVNAIYLRGKSSFNLSITLNQQTEKAKFYTRHPLGFIFMYKLVVSVGKTYRKKVGALVWINKDGV